MTKIKICGLTRPQDIEAINIAKPEYIGFVFFEGSRRYITQSNAAKLRELLIPGITPVGVFVNSEIEALLSLAKDGIVSAIQLHGTENEEYIVKLKSFTSLPVIKAISVVKAGETALWNSSAADYLLLDGKAAGSGQTFNWSLVGAINKPFFLAGGLDVQNAADAISRLAPYALDVSSGVEVGGQKAPDKIIEFARKVRSTNE